MDKRNYLWGFLFILPQLVGMLCFSLIPLLVGLFLSFMKWDGIGTKKFIGFANFAADFQDPLFWKALLNTCYYTILVVPGGVIMALLVAIALNKIRYRRYRRPQYLGELASGQKRLGL